MAKLSHKITTTSNTPTPPNNKLNHNSLSTKKIESENTNPVKQEKKETEQQIVQENTISTPTTKAEFLKFLYDKLGFDNFGKINKQFIDGIFPPETTISDEEATKKIIAHLVSKNIIDVISNFTETQNVKVEKIAAQLSDLQILTQKQETQIKNLTLQIEDAEEQIYKTEKKYADTIAVADLVNSFILSEISNSFTREIAEMLIESYKNGEKQGIKFTLKFLKGFVFVENAILQLGDNDKENINILNDATKQLMSTISGTNSAERRPILDKVANLCNSYLNEYDFISPEQTLQIDPKIHNAEGLGGSIIKEGLSFAVVRRETRKAVYYAEILTR